MCEILLCVKNRGLSGSLAIDSHAPKRGDVICVQADGWGWGACELGQIVQVQQAVKTSSPTNPNLLVDVPTGVWIPHPLGNHNFFRVIKLPNVTVAQAARMLSAEKDVDPQHPSPYLQYRAFFLDYSKVSAVTMAALKANWDDDLRANGSITLNYTATQVNSIVTGTDDVGCPAYHARLAVP